MENLIMDNSSVTSNRFPGVAIVPVLERTREEVETVVQQQYKDCPYPPHDPKKDFEFNVEVPAGVELTTLNHLAFNGKQDFMDFDVLEAGCGTGSSVIYYALQFKNMPGRHRIVALDISPASLEVLRSRMKLRGLKEGVDVTIINGSLLDLPDMKDIGKFDLIGCTGVLHHLASPVDGLKALKSVLKPDGVMHLMVYSTFGRVQTALTRNLLQILLQGVDERKDRLTIASELLQKMPPTHPLNRNFGPRDDKIYGYIGVQDQFDHVHERSYTIKDILIWLNTAGMRFAGFNPAYAPIFNINHIFGGAPLVLEQLKKLPVADQMLCCEMAYGALFKIEFYAKYMSTPNTMIHLNDEAIPYARIHDLFETNRRMLLTLPLGKGLSPDKPYKFNLGIMGIMNKTSDIEITRAMKSVLRRIDGKTTIGEIKSELTPNGITAEEIDKVFELLYAFMGPTGGNVTLLLKDKALRDVVIPDVQEIHRKWLDAEVFKRNIDPKEEN